MSLFASAIDDASKLLEIGFKYVTDIDGKKLFRIETASREEQKTDLS